MSDAPTVAAVRRFNRFYTRRIGVLNEGHLRSPFSLAEVRVLYELAHRDGPTAAELGKELGLDAGYLSRILRRFEERGVIARSPSAADGRQSHLRLTDSGRETFAALNTRSSDEIAAMLAPLSAAEQRRLVEAMHVVERLLGGRAEPKTPYLLRPHQPGDIGWVIHRHGVLYAQEYGWNEEYEALIARIVSDFVQQLDRKRERCWIAERGGEVVEQAGRDDEREQHADHDDEQRRLDEEPPEALPVRVQQRDPPRLQQRPQDAGGDRRRAERRDRERTCRPPRARRDALGCDLCAHSPRRLYCAVRC